MIISASRRTDIPAFYSRWFANRVRAGYCEVANPFNPRQITRVSLRAEDVDAVVFWTRHARPLLKSLPTLDRLGYRYYFQYTITGYGPPLEPHAPPLPAAVACFRQLAATLPRGAVVWRYDPILTGAAFPAKMHLARFAAIAKGLEGCADRVVVSAVQMYRKTGRRLAALYPRAEDLWREPRADPGLPELLAALVAIAARHGMKVEACAQSQDHSGLGIGKSKCVDDRLLSALFGGSWPVSKDRGQRPQCGCIPSRDIGANSSCGFACAYCYATLSPDLARRNRRAHDEHSASIIKVSGR